MKYITIQMVALGILLALMLSGCDPGSGPADTNSQTVAAWHVVGGCQLHYIDITMRDSAAIEHAIDATSRSLQHLADSESFVVRLISAGTAIDEDVVRFRRGEANAEEDNSRDSLTRTLRSTIWSAIRQRRSRYPNWSKATDIYGAFRGAAAWHASHPDRPLTCNIWSDGYQCAGPVNLETRSHRNTSTNYLVHAIVGKDRAELHGVNIAIGGICQDYGATPAEVENICKLWQQIVTATGATTIYVGAGFDDSL